MQLVFVRLNWDNTAIPFTMPGIRSFDLHIRPEPGYPFGRKGLEMARAWQQLGNRDCCGMLVLDGDVAIDPLDFAEMGEAVDLEPAAVHVAPVRLWPASTQRPSWVWGHWCGDGPTQECCHAPDRFTFGFTYLPRQLLARAKEAGMERWVFPGVDLRMAQTARDYGIPVRVVDNCAPKHLHY